MFVACWSVKGGAGTSVVAAALGLILARAGEGGALAVDLAGDLPAVLGLPQPDSPGLVGWLGVGESVPPDALGRLEIPVTDGLGLLPRGDGSPPGAGRAGALLEVLRGEERSVVIDCGNLFGSGAVPGRADPGDTARVLAEGATDSLLVTRACYLALRRVVAAPIRPSGVVLVSETGRALGRRDVEDVVGVDVVAEVPVEAAVARCVDAGLLAGRLPSALVRALGRAV